MWAVNTSNPPMVDVLLRRGAKVGAKSFKGTNCEDFVLSMPLEEQLAYEPRVTKNQPRPMSKEHTLIGQVVLRHAEDAQFRQTLSSASMSSLSEQTPATQGSSPQLFSSSPNPARSSLAQPVSSTPPRRSLQGREQNSKHEAALKARETQEKRRRALFEIANNLRVDYNDLLGEEDRSLEETIRQSRRRRRPSGFQAERQFELSAGCGALEVGADPLSNDFDFEEIWPEQMLVFGERDVPTILRAIIDHCKPIRAPWVARAQTANTLYLCLRYTASLGDDDLLLGTLYAALERVEHKAQLATTTFLDRVFWLFNLTLLLYYCQRDVILCAKTAGDPAAFIRDLIGQLFVDAVRDIEQRINGMLDTSMLEHESIPGLGDVRFEGDWNLIKTIRGSVKGNSQDGHSPVKNKSGTSRRPLSQIFAQWVDSGASGDSSVSAKDTPMSRGDSNGLQRPGSRGLVRKSVANLKKSFEDAEKQLSPRSVTTILNSALQLMQLYETNPATIIQMLSQVFYWLGAELFNRVLGNKRWLCRSRAMQLKLNVSALEDWARTNALPLSIVASHLAPLNQLISWISCQSSLRDLPALVHTLQGLPRLTPPQMRRVVKDYRYEVGEDKMSIECVQYLDQISVDWRRQQEQAQEDAEEQQARMELERMRQAFLEADVEPTAGRPYAADDTAVDATVVHDRSRTITANDAERPDQPATDFGEPDNRSAGSDIDTTMPDTSAGSMEVAREQERRAQMLIDSLFLPGRSLSDYTPPILPSASLLQEDLLALHSSAILPFALPSSTEALIVSPGDALGFGRGHFSGTGTPSLRHMPGKQESLASSSSQASGPEDETQSQKSLPRIPSSSSSSTSASSAAASSTSSSIFVTGKGFAAGGYWQPVPLLRDEWLQSPALQAARR